MHHVNKKIRQTTIQCLTMKRQMNSIKLITVILILLVLNIYFNRSTWRIKYNEDWFIFGCFNSIRLNFRHYANTKRHVENTQINNNVCKAKSYFITHIFICIYTLGISRTVLEGLCASRYVYYYTRSFAMEDKMNEVIAAFHHIFFLSLFFPSKCAKKGHF